MTSVLNDIAPVDIGMPPKFTVYRQSQREALDWLDTGCAHAISAGLLPTGAGKTLVGMSYGRIRGTKMAYAVATKGLQTQVFADFKTTGLVDIRGRANYHCRNYGDCNKGYDQECSLHQTTACPYNVAVETAKDADIILTNYAYWLHARGNNRKALERDFRPIDFLVCDEAHELEKQVTDFASVHIYASEQGRAFPRVESTGPMETPAAQSIVQWARRTHERLAGSKDTDDKDLAARCLQIIQMSGNWVWQLDDKTGAIVFEPIHIAPHLSGVLANVPRVLLMSATLNKFTMSLLLGRDTLYDYRAWPSVFSPAAAPVYHIPTVKLSWKSSDSDYGKLIEQADQIISSRTDRKGILHTVSYGRSKRILEHSRHRDRFIWNDTGGSDLSRCLERFRRSAPGTCLVTPSVGTGFDFPGTEAEYQIVLKFPFPNEQQRVVRERCERIPGYRLNAAAQALVQMAGRIRRSEADRGETFVLDNAVRQLCGPSARSYVPPGFRIFTVTQVPPAPPKL